MQKRNNPFAKKTSEQSEIENVLIETTPEVEEEVFEIEQPVKYVEKATPRPAQKSYNTVPSNKNYYEEDVVRDKYTSTMDRNLRRQIKIVCATRGIMFAQFVEEACKEKLKKEGVR